MKAQELRIGNYVLDSGGKVLRIDFFEHLQSGYDCKFGQRMFIDGAEVHPLTEYTDIAKPIPLTEQWLIDFGFKRENRSTISADFWKGINPLTKDWLFSLIWIYDYEKNHPYPLKGYPFYKNGYFEITHVHQLQNLYFALTGEELQL